MVIFAWLILPSFCPCLRFRLPEPVISASTPFVKLLELIVPLLFILLVFVKLPVSATVIVPALLIVPLFSNELEIDISPAFVILPKFVILPAIIEPTALSELLLIILPLFVIKSELNVPPLVNVEFELFTPFTKSLI